MCKEFRCREREREEERVKSEKLKIDFRMQLKGGDDTDAQRRDDYEKKKKQKKESSPGQVSAEAERAPAKRQVARKQCCTAYPHLRRPFMTAAGVRTSYSSV